jgi:hypothetical protein
MGGALCGQITPVNVCSVWLTTLASRENWATLRMRPLDQSDVPHGPGPLTLLQGHRSGSKLEETDKAKLPSTRNVI